MLRCHVRDAGFLCTYLPLSHFTLTTVTDDAWKHRFASRCLSTVHEQAFGARTPNYTLITQLDKKVKDYYVPPSLHVPGFGGAKMMELATPSIELTMQRHIVFAIKEISKW